MSNDKTTNGNTSSSMNGSTTNGNVSSSFPINNGNTNGTITATSFSMNERRLRESTTSGPNSVDSGIYS